MKFRLICVGRLAEDWLKQGAAEYLGRLKRHYAVEIIELKEEQGSQKDVVTLLRREGQRILQRIPSDAFTLVLDEKGKPSSSEALAKQLQAAMLHGARDWCLVIGGPYGLDDAVRQRADQLLSLSKMTLTHQMARVLLLEQLYRSGTIIRNEPYHNR
ncbi:MAG: 23S rRNA (pseudouridine(1915)-N(3))-methyltransferase RlmH [Deltaproteobacteria bacterium]|nr:23S rRNA (pseudouridine(1915)-N(3))-methyltransferase RlmH [Deltaproteobacteria bacterium]NCP04112.1 23S rRNA (pseudouridine(1915)-N(3))-methyltransferase RlmH [Deltaproteobacteria bacterium]NCP77985.1 23S rRNA (pseudouridine(1915)-N(3))-methyltransferase RlmH [Desulfuromonadales bacterium]